MTNSIESPIRTAIIIAAARAMNITDIDLLDFAIDSYDIDSSLADLSLIDAPTADHRSDLIALINTLTNSDDDHDDMIHDLTHATDQLDFCTDHPATCDACCDLH